MHLLYFDKLTDGKCIIFAKKRRQKDKDAYCRQICVEIGINFAISLETKALVAKTRESDWCNQSGTETDTRSVKSFHMYKKNDRFETMHDTHKSK